MRRARALVFVLGFGACGTRFVDLTLPDGAPASTGGTGGTSGEGSSSGTGGSTGMGGSTGTMGDPNLRCESVKRADGTECKICYAADGSITNGQCFPVMTTMPPAAVDPTMLECKVSPMPDNTRCLYCPSSPKDYTACLKCDAPTKTGAAGETCRACMWNDLTVSCLQCFDAKGAPTHDDCDTFRKEKFIPVMLPPAP